MRINEFLPLLHGAKQVSAGRWRAKCPAHSGNSDSSLAVRAAENGDVLIHCFGGCPASSIVEAMGLKLVDLFAEARDTATAEAARGKGAQLAAYDRLLHELYVLLPVVEARVASRRLEGDQKFRESRPDWCPYPGESWEREIQAASTIHSLLEKIYGN